MAGLEGLYEGLAVAVSPTNILMVFLGVLIGMVVGILPGLGPTATMAMLLPLTFTLDPASAIILLAGIFYGAMYGGTITAVLVRVPGEIASVVTTFDGYEMARRGRAGSALGVAAVGSFVGGVIAVFILAALAAPLAGVARKFGPPELFLVALLGIFLVLAIASGSLVKAALVAAVGALTATIGLDPVNGAPRFTFGSVELFHGLDIVALVMGLFGIGEVLYQLRTRPDPAEAPRAPATAWPTRSDLRDSVGPIGRGTLVGSALGLVPGAGTVMSSMASYALEKRIAKEPERFGRGAVEGVAGPETANNAASSTSFLPLLTLGIPTGTVMALIYGALIIQGITPGPTLVVDHPQVFWGVIASMLVGNVMLLVLNIPLVGAFVQLLRIRVGIIGGITILITMIGVYSLNNRVFDMYVAIGAGLAGYLLRRGGFELGPLVLAALLGVMMERQFRASMLMSDGDVTIFVTRPVSLVFLLVIVVLAMLFLLRTVRARDRTEVA